ncbi:MAG: asparagine synthase (glutamine-hydrolyzing) [Planctomycetota bacterium]|nr:MAG: asparagine synthase (glutamine-hydrolyzing) [Planctomycetota bacterium]
MCGIAGIVWQDPARPGDGEGVLAMARALAHRGPDGEGVEVLGPAALGHRRLAVIDLSEAARQPLSNEDGSVWTVFNGEVYNFAALREELEARGHRFRSRTDSEVIVHLYEELGAGLVERLRGMFAFALWDAREQRLLLARDRAGQKPLHYALDAEALRFASEPAALFAAGGAPPPAPDAEAICLYLHYGWVPAPRSAFAGVRKLPPAHLLEWRPGGPASLRRYWTPSYGPKHDASSARARAALVEELGVRVDEAVRSRLVADVPVGAFLSGGIDSGLVVASMARARAEPVRTFTIGFEQAAYDESELAEATARHCGTDHRRRVVRPDALELLPRLLRHYGEPFADSSALPTYRVSELAREDVTVVLSGDGGDELLAGYLRYGASVLAGLLDFWPASLRQALGAQAERLPELGWPRDPLRYLKRFLAAGGRDPARRAAEWTMIVKPALARRLLQPEVLATLRGLDPTDVYAERYAAAPGATCPGERVLWADFCLYLPDDILTKVDVASMSHSLEARAPLLDHRLVEWILRLPWSLKIRRGEQKWIARRLAERRLPRAVARGGKYGFSVPLDAWFRGPLLPLFRETVLAPDARVRAWVRPVVVEELLQQHLARRARWEYPLWAILWLELWHREVLEGAGALRGG